MQNSTAISQKNENSISSILYRVFVGIMFGFANVIPGVSGGTVMVVLGVYERIIGIITDFKHKIKTEWKFFLPILVGMGIAILIFGSIMSTLLDKHKDVTQMFFIGVIIFSIPQIFKCAAFDARKKWNLKPQYIVAFVLVLALMVFMSLSKANDELKDIKAKKNETAQTQQVNEESNTSEEAQDENTEKTEEKTEVKTEEKEEDSYKPDHSALHLILQVVFGAIACATMIIPGISGSLVMVMLGQYEGVMHALKHFDILVLLPFGIGCLIGLIFCAKLIRWLLSKHSQLTYAAILGFVVGSIFSVFPGWDAVFSLSGIIAFVIGGACIIGCDLLSRKFNPVEDRL